MYVIDGHVLISTSASKQGPANIDDMHGVMVDVASSIRQFRASQAKGGYTCPTASFRQLMTPDNQFTTAIGKTGMILLMARSQCIITATVV